MSAQADSEPGAAAAGERSVPLDLMPRAVFRRRAASMGAFAVLVAAAIGGVVGLVSDRLPGLITVGAIAAPLLLLAFGEFRRHSWLVDGVVSARALRTRSVDLRRPQRLELLITEVRGNRVVGLLVGGPPRGRTINIPLASYSGLGGRELDIVALRRLADALAGGDDTRGLVFAELLVAALRAEAREEATTRRPLFRLAALAPSGRLAQRMPADTVTRFVAGLD